MCCNNDESCASCVIKEFSKYASICLRMLALFSLVGVEGNLSLLEMLWMNELLCHLRSCGMMISLPTNKWFQPFQSAISGYRFRPSTCGCGSKPMVPFWGRCTTHFRSHFRWDWDVHWGRTIWILTHGHVFLMATEAMGSRCGRCGSARGSGRGPEDPGSPGSAPSGGEWAVSLGVSFNRPRTWWRCF